MAARPKFSTRPKPTKDGKYQIILRLSINSKRQDYYCGISIRKSDFNSEYWKRNKKPIKSAAFNAANFNNRLQNIEADALKLLSETKGENLNWEYIKNQLDLIYKPQQLEQETEEENFSFINYFENAINDSKSGKRVISSGRTQYIGKQYEKGSIISIEGALAAIKRFMEHNEIKDLTFEEINLDFYKSFRAFCFEVEGKERSTFGKYIKHIKTLMQEADKGELIKDFKKTTNETDSVYLNVEQIKLIDDLNLDDKNKYYTNEEGKHINYSTLEKVRDLFLVGCYSGLRFSDFSNLKTSSIEDGFLRMKQVKTGDRVTIPISKDLKSILEKYENKLPTITNQKFNEYIKHVAELAGLTETITISNSKGNKINTNEIQLYSLISSHCCRRSYATNMFKAGVSPMLIMAATGHKTESSFLKYIRATNEDKAKLLAEQMKKLGL